MLAAPTLQKKIYTDCTLLENPRVRGSIPRLGTIFESLAVMRGFVVSGLCR